MGFWWILIVLIILLPLLFYKQWAGNGNRSVSRESALEILERRYANGEIDSKEYRERKNELLSG